MSTQEKSRGFFESVAYSLGQGLSSKTATSSADGSSAITVVQEIPPMTNAGMSVQRTARVASQGLIGVYGTEGVTILGATIVDPFNVQNTGAFMEILEEFIARGGLTLQLGTAVTGNGAGAVTLSPDGMVPVPGFVLNISDSALNWQAAPFTVTFEYATPLSNTTLVYSLIIQARMPGSLFVLGMAAPFNGSTNLSAIELSNNYRGVATYTNPLDYTVAGAWATLRTQAYIPANNHPLWSSLGRGNVVDVLATTTATTAGYSGR